MSFLKVIKTALGLGSGSVTDAGGVARAQPLFVYIKLPGNIQPLERGQFEDPLADALETSGLGEVTGGGSQLDDPGPDGRPRVAFAGIDVDLFDVELGVALLVRELRRLNAPPGTVLLYQLDGHEHEVRVHDP
jgi:hypothetical protein